jgi:hypothetical protein
MGAVSLAEAPKQELSTDQLKMIYQADSLALLKGEVSADAQPGIQHVKDVAGQELKERGVDMKALDAQIKNDAAPISTLVTSKPATMDMK